MTGSLSLLVTALPFATFVTPAGARKGSRGRPEGLLQVGNGEVLRRPLEHRLRKLEGKRHQLPARGGLGRGLGVQRAGDGAEEEGRDPERREAEGGPGKWSEWVRYIQSCADYVLMGPP